MKFAAEHRLTLTVYQQRVLVPRDLRSYASENEKNEKGVIQS
jgi:hypothetical protein